MFLRLKMRAKRRKRIFFSYSKVRAGRAALLCQVTENPDTFYLVLRFIRCFPCLVQVDLLSHPHSNHQDGKKRRDEEG